jgi:hypothetical protein
MTTIFRILEASAEDKPAHLLHGVMEANGLTLVADRVGRIVYSSETPRRSRSFREALSLIGSMIRFGPSSPVLHVSIAIT